MISEQERNILIENRFFPIRGRIDERTHDSLGDFLSKAYQKDKKKKIDLLIDSGGGDVEPALTIFDLLKAMPFETDSTIIGKCNSAALIINAACSKRRATKHSSFLFHAMCSSRTMFTSTEHLTDMEAWAKHAAMQNKKIFDQGLKLQSLAYNISEAELLKMMELGEKYSIKLTAEEAKEKGIIHEIVEKFDFLKAA